MFCPTQGIWVEYIASSSPKTIGFPKLRCFHALLSIPAHAQGNFPEHVYDIHEVQNPHKEGLLVAAKFVRLTCISSEVPSIFSGPLIGAKTSTTPTDYPLPSIEFYGITLFGKWLKRATDEV